MASWVETFKQPVREIKKRFTKSDLALYAWDSRWKSYQLQQSSRSSTQPAEPSRTKDAQKPSGRKEKVYPNGVVETENSYRLPSGANNGVEIPKSFFNEEGELDMRKIPGSQASKYMRGLGFPIMSR